MRGVVYLKFIGGAVWHEARKAECELNGIEYTGDIGKITAKALHGFFVGWAKPLTPDEHYRHLANCFCFVAALDGGRAAGFVSALSDGAGCAFIPLLEVLPEYQRRGIGTELMRRMLENLKDISAIDLMCDESAQGFYGRFGMKKLSGMGIRKNQGE